MSSKQRNLRKKRVLDDEEERAPDEVEQGNLEDIKLMQRQRRKIIGIDAKSLALGDEKEGAAGASAQEDTKLMETYVKATSAVVADESVHMQRFIEKELNKRLGRPADDPFEALTAGERQRMQQEKELFAVPEQLKATLQQEVVLPGLITGLSEVPLSMEQKMRNIEETEAIKARLLASQRAGLQVGFEDEQPQQQNQRIRRGSVPFEFGRNAGREAMVEAPRPQERREYRRVIKDPAVREFGARPAGAGRGRGGK